MGNKFFTIHFPAFFSAAYFAAVLLFTCHLFFVRFPQFPVQLI